MFTSECHKDMLLGKFQIALLIILNLIEFTLLTLKDKTATDSMKVIDFMYFSKSESLTYLKSHKN